MTPVAAVAQVPSWPRNFSHAKGGTNKKKGNELEDVLGLGKKAREVGLPWPRGRVMGSGVRFLAVHAMVRKVGLILKPSENFKQVSHTIWFMFQ